MACSHPGPTPCCSQFLKTARSYGISANIFWEMFLIDTAYRPNADMLLEKIKVGLRLLVVRFLPDILDGSIKLEDPEAFVALAQQVCS